MTLVTHTHTQNVPIFGSRHTLSLTLETTEVTKSGESGKTNLQNKALQPLDKASSCEGHTLLFPWWLGHKDQVGKRVIQTRFIPV